MSRIPEVARSLYRVAALSVSLFVLLSVAARSQQTPQTDSLRQAALALEQQGRNSEAEEKWRAFLNAHPKSPEAYAHLGLLEARQERYAEAVPLYRKALELGPPVASVKLNLGLALFKAGDMRGAIAEFEPLLKAQNGNLQLLTLTAMAHYGLGEYQEAIPYLRQAADLDTKNLPLRFALAQSCLWTKQDQCVMDVYKEILELDPNSAEADMIAGEALDEMKDNEGSTKMFRAAVKANPKELGAHFGLGYLLWTQKQYLEAASEFQAELANDPDNVQARLYLADTYIQLNRIQDAGPLLEKVVKVDPSIGLGHLDLGIVYSEASRNEDALRELTLAAKLTPDDVNVHWRLGRLYRTQGKKDEAKAEFDKASTLNKAADEDLYKKIANGRAPAPAADSTPAPAPPQQPGQPQP
jgi:tetratricopeptide (TPR) repeat protein